HVEERLLVHRLVLEDAEYRLGAIEQRMSGALDVGVRERVGDAPIRLGRERAHVRARGPVGQPAARALLVGIDAAREERLEPRVDAWAAKTFLDQRVEAEGRQMSFVEHNRMPQ